jgi:hypothetical protein
MRCKLKAIEKPHIRQITAQESIRRLSSKKVTADSPGHEPGPSGKTGALVCGISFSLIHAESAQSSPGLGLECLVNSSFSVALTIRAAASIPFSCPYRNTQKAQIQEVFSEVGAAARIRPGLNFDKKEEKFLIWLEIGYK